jgi:uncharacterized membrane protein
MSRLSYPTAPTYMLRLIAATALISWLGFIGRFCGTWNSLNAHLTTLFRFTVHAISNFAACSAIPSLKPQSVTLRLSSPAAFAIRLASILVIFL